MTITLLLLACIMFQCVNTMLMIRSQRASQAMYEWVEHLHELIEAYGLVEDDERWRW
ncbi:hypothetical protein LCGC14_0357090 [marine sediment metagenome]|uniref:Secreted protein n=1 Tax=marine sediment metagenome TaxID=412755 RepID=A0A0F9T939_9ZZZZ